MVESFYKDRQIVVYDKLINNSKERFTDRKSVSICKYIADILLAGIKEQYLTCNKLINIDICQTCSKAIDYDTLKSEFRYLQIRIKFADVVSFQTLVEELKRNDLEYF